VPGTASVSRVTRPLAAQYRRARPGAGTGTGSTARVLVLACRVQWPLRAAGSSARSRGPFDSIELNRFFLAGVHIDAFLGAVGLPRDTPTANKRSLGVSPIQFCTSAPTTTPGHLLSAHDRDW
jgi:hypothetical protein